MGREDLAIGGCVGTVRSADETLLFSFENHIGQPMYVSAYCKKDGKTDFNQPVEKFPESQVWIDPDVVRFAFEHQLVTNRITNKEIEELNLEDQVPLTDISSSLFRGIVVGNSYNVAKIEADGDQRTLTIYRKV